MAIFEIDGCRPVRRRGRDREMAGMAPNREACADRRGEGEAGSFRSRDDCIDREGEGNLVGRPGPDRAWGRDAETRRRERPFGNGRLGIAARTN